MPLVSNRRQDYHGALHILARVFQEFLESAPEKATRALMDLLESYVAQWHSSASGKTQKKVFDFDGQQVRLCLDYSWMWDGNDRYHLDPSIQLLDAFQQFLEQLASRQDREGTLRALIGILVSESRVAVVWRRLLIAGAHFLRPSGGRSCRSPGPFPS
ncbi:MAG: hypothetical protein AB7T14_09550 [Candidatus Methylacidiphilaceae bacterium]